MSRLSSPIYGTMKRISDAFRPPVGSSRPATDDGRLDRVAGGPVRVRLWVNYRHEQAVADQRIEGRSISCRSRRSRPSRPSSARSPRSTRCCAACPTRRSAPSTEADDLLKRTQQALPQMTPSARSTAMVIPWSPADPPGAAPAQQVRDRSYFRAHTAATSALTSARSCTPRRRDPFFVVAAGAPADGSLRRRHGVTMPPAISGVLRASARGGNVFALVRADGVFLPAGPSTRRPPRASIRRARCAGERRGSGGAMFTVPFRGLTASSAAPATGAWAIRFTSPPA